jgi:RNA chaperone Hfq
MGTIINEVKPQQPLSAPLKPAPPVAPVSAKQDVPPAIPKDPHFVQSGFLSAARRSGAVMEFVLNSGRTVTGRVVSFDQFSIAVEVGGRTKLLYKHGIETMEEQNGNGTLHRG